MVTFSLDVHANIDGWRLSSKAKYMICSTELGNSSPAVPLLLLFQDIVALQ